MNSNYLNWLSENLHSHICIKKYGIPFVIAKTTVYDYEVFGNSGFHIKKRNI